MSAIDESPATGLSFRLDLEHEAVEVDLLRVDPRQPEVLLEVFGRLGSNSQPDSVVASIPVDEIPKLTGALMRAYRLGRDERTKALANDEKRRSGK